MPEPEDRSEDRSQDPHDPQDRQEPSAPEVGRDRLLTALLRPSRRQAVVGVLLALVGFSAVVQVRANDLDDSYSTLRQQDLIDVLNGLAGTSQRTQAEIDRLTRTRDQLQSETSARQAALDQARTQVDSLNVLAGLVPVTGPGIRVTITEETGRIRLSSLLDTIEEVRTVGAEAIQVNGSVRVVAQTSFERTPSGFVADGTALEPPYVLDVIGEPDTLARAITFRLGPLAEIRSDGGDATIDKLGSLDIESVAQPPTTPEYAERGAGQ